MLARARGVPMLVRLGDALPRTRRPVQLDAEHGHLIADPDSAQKDDFARDRTAFANRQAGDMAFLPNPAHTADGTPIRVLINIADLSETEKIDPAHCDGVGLLRTEFLFGGTGGLPDEDTQYRAYRTLIDWADGRPVTIRTLDAGGDKPIVGLTEKDEPNPFLGLRGIRLSLARPDIFRIQARALLRAAAHGPLKVMFPMISVPAEFEAARSLFAEEAERLHKEGIDHAMPQFGVMVEVPAVAIVTEAFSAVRFFSIGTNDLTQYVMAAARDNADLSTLSDVTQPAVLHLIEAVCDYGHTAGIPVSLCGDAGSDPDLLPALLRTGLREISVAPARLGAIKAAIARVTL